MTKTTDINQERSEKYRYLEKLSYVPKLIIISSICGFVATLSLLMAILALNDAKEAKIRTEYQDEKITQLRERVDYWTAHTTALRAELKANGYEPPPLEEKN